MSEISEEHERVLDPHRVEEQRSARREAIDRLRDRGIPVYPSDADEELADMLDAVERFEAVVEAQGGDLFVNRIGSAEPQDPAFIPPIRERDENASSYRLRVLAAGNALRRRRGE